MDVFKPGDKVIKRNETDASKHGTVMERQNRPLFQKPGYLAVYFQRQVWIKPENLMHYDVWLAKRQKMEVPSGSVRDYWTK